MNQNDDYMNEELKERFDRLERLSIMAAKNVLTIGEAALILGLSKNYIYKLTMKKKIPYYKPNAKTVYFKRSELEAWALTNRRGTAAEAEQKAAAYCAGGGLR